MTTDESREQAIEQAVTVICAHRLAHDSTGGFRGILGGWNRNCVCGWHGVDHETSDRAFEHHLADMLAGAADTTEAEGLHAVRALAAEIDRDRAVADLTALRDKVRTLAEDIATRHNRELEICHSGQTGPEVRDALRRFHDELSALLPGTKLTE